MSVPAVIQCTSPNCHCVPSHSSSVLHRYCPLRTDRLHSLPRFFVASKCTEHFSNVSLRKVSHKATCSHAVIGSKMKFQTFLLSVSVPSVVLASSVTSPPHTGLVLPENLCRIGHMWPLVHNSGTNTSRQIRSNSLAMCPCQCE